MTKRWLWLIGLIVLAVPARSQMTAVSALVQDANGERYVNCSWSVVFVGQNTIPGAGPYQPAALLVGQQGNCDSSGNLTVSLADNVNTIRPTPSQWNFSICSAPGYVPGGTFCRSNMLVTITGASQNLTSFFQPLMPLLPTGGGGGAGYITDATPLGGLMRTGTTLGLQTTCIAGQYLGWNGSAWACTGAGVGGGTSVSINGTQAVPNSLNFTNTLLPPSGNSVVTFMLNGNTVGAYVPSSGGGGGGTLPTTPVYDLFASTGAGGAQASGVLGSNGFVRAQVYTATGDVTSASPGFQLFPNGSVEYFPTGYSNAQGNFGATNGLALYMSHSGQSSATGNGGIALGGGNSSGTGNEIYLDCEVAGCDFKVPLTVNGAGVGGGGGGLPTIPAPNLYASNGSGSAVDSGVLGQSGFLRAYVLEATGTGNASPFAVPNGSIEYFPTGGYGAGGANGVALHVSHSGSATGFGGIALAGGNTSGTDQLYLDCEGPPVVSALGCDFKVPVTYLGAGIGGGGGGSGTVASGTGNYFAWYPTTGTTVNSNSNLSDNGALITSQEPLAAPGINVTGNGGIAMTGAGGSLPTPVAGQGGIGIGQGNVPEFYSNGGAWTAIGSGGGGTAGVSSINTVTGAFTFTGAGVSCATTTCTFSGGGVASVPNPILTTAGTTLPAPVTGQGSIGIGPNGVPSISVNGGTWLPIATSSGGTSVPIAHGAQTPVCQAESTTSPIVVSGLTINNGDTVLVGVASYFTDSTWTVVDSNGDSYALTAAVERSNGASSLIYASAVGAARAANSITVTLTSATFRKTVVCIATYTGVTALGTSNTSTGASSSGPQTLSLTAAAAGNFLFTVTTLGSASVASGFTTINGTLLAWNATTATAASSGAICENEATSAGTVTCETQQSSGTFAWSMAGVELVGGGTGGGSQVTTPYTCTIPSNVTFTTTAGTICSQALGATAKQWIVHCNLPFNFTSGTGTTNIGINLVGTPTFQTYITTMLGAAAGPTYGSVAVSASGQTQMITRAVTDATLYTLTLDGTIAAAANTTFSIYGTASAGTAAFRPGVACVLQ